MRQLFLIIISFISVNSIGQPGSILFAKKASTSSGYYRAITVDHTKVPNTNQDSIPILWRSPVGTVNTVGTAVTLASGDNFPTWMTDSIMINGTVYKVSSISTSSALVLASSAGTQTGVAYNGTPWLRHTSFGGKVTDLQGDDIKMCVNSSGSALYYWDIEKYDSSTGVTVVWSNIPVLPTATDLVYYIRYGGTETTYQGNRVKTWTTAHLMVQHMNQPKTAESQTILDATSNANNFTTVGSPWTTGQTAAGAVGDATSILRDNFQFLSFSSISLTGDYTMSYWVKITVQSHESITFGNSGSAADINWFAGKHREYDGSGDKITATTTSSTDVWYKYTITRSGTSMVMYINGASDATSSNGANVSFNRFGASNSTFTLVLYADEIRILSDDITADKEATEYNNQSSPNTFQSTGSQN